MTLPAEATGGIEVFIRASGKVVRVDKRTDFANQPVGVAVIIVLHVKSYGTKTGATFREATPESALYDLTGRQF